MPVPKLRLHRYAWPVVFGLFSGIATAGPFELAPLPYDSSALEPYIDQQTMEIHHGRHHRAYVANLNAQVENYPELRDMSLEEIMPMISRFNMAVRDNAGGHYNHKLFWDVMAPAGHGGEPSAELLAAIERDFGSLQAMQALVNRAAATRFGSGWAWLIVTAEGKLAVTSTPNQDNPLMDIVPDQGVPILGIDVWEHAYYLAYQNRRGAYLDFWWNVVNWDSVSRRYAEAMNP